MFRRDNQLHIDTSIPEQIGCVQREIFYRERVYPGMVARGKMKQGDADRQLTLMKAVLQTLRNLVDDGK